MHLTCSTLGPEMSRAPGPTRTAFSDSVEAAIVMIEEVLSNHGAKGSATRERAVASLATVVGGMILARAEPDPARRGAMLAACRTALQRSEGEA